MISHPFFWRHLAAYTLGGALTLLGTLGAAAFPVLLPVAGKLVISGAGLLALAGTGTLEPKKKEDPS